MFKSGNVTLMVSDLGRSVRFYRDALGMHLDYQAGEHWAQLSAPGITVGLHPRDPKRKAQPAGEALSIGFEVDHLDQTMAILQARGVEFKPEIQEDPGLRIAFFGDPDGTPLYLMQTLRKGGPEGWN